MAAPSLARVQAALAIAVVLVSGGVLGHLTLVASDVAFLPGGGEGWIGFRFPVRAGVIRTPQPPAPFAFSRTFELDSRPRHARLEVQAIEDLQLELNGEPLLGEPRAAWREGVVLDVADRLRAGRNELRALVRRSLGPPLLRLELRVGGQPLLRTDESWSVARPGSAPVQARFADDTRMHPESLRGPTPGELFRERAGVLAVWLALGTALAYLLEGRLARSWTRHLSLGVLLAISLGWLGLLLGRLVDLPLEVGFDADGHLAYAAHLREHGSLPRATDGVSMFHPPLFYVLTAGVTALAGASVGDPQAVLAHRLVPWAAGLGTVWCVWFAARRLFDDDPLRTTLAVVAAGMLPMHLYMSAYVSNESTATLTVSSLLALLTALLLAPSPSRRGWAAVAVLGGLALLSKYSGFVTVPLAFGVVALRWWVVDRRPFPRVLAAAASLGAGALLVGGWFYARHWLLLGTPFPWNREAGGPGLWWHLPGFHTPEYFTGFGMSLRHPLFAGFQSYADGVYSTLWGDALAAGTSHPWGNPGGWNLDWMFVAYLLAVPVTGLVGLGVARAVLLAVRDPQPRRRLAWTLVLLVPWAIGLSHLAFAIRYPSYAASKAFYALPALLPLALVAALGLAWLPERLRGERLRPARALYFGALFTLGAALVLSFRG